MKKLVMCFLVAIALAGCGGEADCVAGWWGSCSGVGGDRCSAKSKCSADPVPTPADIKACQDSLKPPDGGTVKCLTEVNAFFDCYLANQVCGTDNKTDMTKTMDRCRSELNAYTTCLSK